MRILLTGSSGTIGTRLFETLLPKHEMVGVDIRQNKWKSELNGHTVIADLRKSEELAKLPTDFDKRLRLLGWCPCRSRTVFFVPSL